jgi:3-deoxy-D-manno-octulosonic-acid transferase
MYLLYTIILALGLIAVSPLLLLKDIHDGRYTRFLSERFGFVRPLPGGGAIWVHAVSVGETLAVERLLATLREQFPQAPVVLSVTTASGRALAEKRIRADRIFYFPLDLPFAVRRSLRAIEPALVLIVETEIWPNFLRLASERGARVVFVNGRISGRSYARYRLVRRLMRRALSGASRMLMQSHQDAQRILDLGADSQKVEIAGNLKFDLMPPQKPQLIGMLQAQMHAAGVEHVVVAGSTMEGEDELVLRAFERLRADYPATVLILAPRHPQRFGRVEQAVRQFGFPLVRRTALPGAPVARGGVLLLDTVGELAAVYGLADVAFVGGSLVPHGGHNLLEPAYFAVPIVFGPYMQNFAAIAEQFIRANAAMRADSSIELGNVCSRLLGDEAMRRRIGVAARELLESQRGATARALEVIADLLPAPPAAVVPAGPET